MHSDMWIFPWTDPNDPKQVPTADLKKKFSSFTGPKSRRTEAKYGDTPGSMLVFGNTFHKKPAGSTKYEEISDNLNLETFWPWGFVTGDFDNDGYEDIFIPSGMGYPFFYWPNFLMMNNNGASFSQRAREAGIEPHPSGNYQDEKIGGKEAFISSRAAAVADFDGDGRLEIMVTNFNGKANYFKNVTPKENRNYIKFRLQGAKRKGDGPGSPEKKSNRDAIGALVTIHMGNEKMTRQVHGACGYMSHSSLALHFGLGDRMKVDWVEIQWPSGLREKIEAPQINNARPMLIEEGKNTAL
jgi:hypothetical protein